VSEIDLEKLAEEIQRERAVPREAESKVRMGRPSRLSHRDEFELYCYRKSGVAIKTCAGMYRVSVPTANRIIAKFRRYDERVEPLAREFRDMIESLVDST
jgi:hypothetical protein